MGVMDASREELREYLKDLEGYRMPFGRYGPKALPPDGVRVVDLPLEYLHWFQERGGGFPTGRLGELMEFVYHVKASGAEEVFAPLRRGTAGGEALRRKRGREHRFRGGEREE
jgi:uncharacterized protein (DUF3820 family)